METVIIKSVFEDCLGMPYFPGCDNLKTIYVPWLEGENDDVDYWLVAVNSASIMYGCTE